VATIEEVLELALAPVDLQEPPRETTRLQFPVPN